MMFRNIFRSSAAKATMAGSAAAMTGSAYLWAQARSNHAMVAQCEKKEETSTTVVGLLQGIAASVSRMEATLGTASQSPSSSTKHGIDVVLGAQWGDEGKGKLVDMLSQVS
jgi:adenylosuccinate synthase